MSGHGLPRYIPVFTHTYMIIDRWVIYEMIINSIKINHVNALQDNNDIGHGDHDGYNDGGDEGDVHGGIDDDADYLATLTG